MSLNPSEFSERSEIDLRQGKFSSIGVDRSADGTFGTQQAVIGDASKTSDNPDPGNVAIAYYTVIENAVGTNQGDTLIGNAWNNHLEGGDSRDDINGGAGDDLLFGEEGNDRLFGDDGDDTLRGGQGKDELDGGAGSDWADYSDAPEGVSIALAAAGGETLVANDGFGTSDRLRNIENLRGSNQTDVLTGNDEGNKLEGGKGSDTLTGGLGGDTFVFSTGDGSDVVKDYTLEQQDWLQLKDVADKAGLSTVRVNTDGTADPAGTDLLIEHGSGDKVQVENFFTAQTNAIRIIMVQFANATAPDAVLIAEDGSIFDVANIEPEALLIANDNRKKPEPLQRREAA